jgi:integrase/recombinase XerC
VLAGLFMGMRAAEIASIHWQKFDTDLTLYACLGKGSRTRHLPVIESPFKDRLLSVEPADRVGWLFPGSRDRAHVHPTTVLGWTRRLSAEAGIQPIHTHQMRHTFASKLLERSSGDIRMAQELLGHAKPETTAGYTRVRADRLREGMRLVRYGPDESDDGFDDAA